MNSTVFIAKTLKNALFMVVFDIICYNHLDFSLISCAH
jgi:hypothetical protein